MSTTLIEVQKLLKDPPLSLAFVQRGSLPATPEVCAAIYEYPGLEPEYVFGKATIDIEHPRLQIAFRGAPDDYEEPRARAESAYRYLGSLGHGPVNGTRYLTIRPLQPPFRIDYDKNRRWVIGFNVHIDKEPSV